MHEMALAQGIVALVDDEARKHAFARARTVFVEVGALAGVDAEAIRFCFDAAARGSVAEGANLVILDSPGAGFCLDCAEQVALAHRYDACPRCGGYHLQVTAGTELRVKELEIA